MMWIERQKTSIKGRLWLTYEVRQNEREQKSGTIWTAHTVTVNSLIESNKQTNKQLRIERRRSMPLKPLTRHHMH